MTTATRTRRTTKTRKTRPPLTEEQKNQRAAERAERREHVNTLASTALMSMAVNPEAWRSFLWTAAMHPQRPGVVNLALIAHQAPGELTDDYHGWRARGRQVRKGETSRVLIYTAVIRRERKEDSDEERERLGGFGTGKLHTFAQTDPREGEDTPPAAPMQRDPAHVAQAAAAVLEAHYGMSYEPTADNARILLAVLAAKRHKARYGADFPATRAESESAAYVAAVMLGIPDPGPAPLPEMQPISLDPKNPHADVKDTGERVMTLGRQIAAELAR